MSSDRTDLAARLEASIAEKVGPQRYRIWFKNATQFHFADGFLKISVPNVFIGSWIENHFAGIIAEIAQEITGKALELSFSVDPALTRNLRKRQLDSQVDFIASNPERIARECKREGGPARAGRPPRGRLEEFTVGPCNELAYQCAKTVVERPGQVYNPLFIHGGCGLGKTHLLQGVANAIVESGSKLSCIYVSGEEFTNHFVYALRTGNRDAFRHRFRSAGVLLIDDVHFLANKKATQEEFLYTFNSICSDGRQVVLASDAHPKLIGSLSESLVSRFISGMVTKVEAPDFEHRVRILQQRCRHMKWDVPAPVLEYVAEKAHTNIRELEGALLKLMAFANIAHQPLTLALAQQALQDHLSRCGPIIRLSDIESVSAIYFGLTPADLHTSRKTRTIALSRAVAMVLARRHTTMSFPEIGRLMGNKNHSTVILACAKMNRILEQDGDVRWSTAAGEQTAKLRPILEQLEEQLGLGNGRSKAPAVRSAAPPERHTTLRVTKAPPVPATNGHSMPRPLAGALRAVAELKTAAPKPAAELPPAAQMITRDNPWH